MGVRVWVSIMVEPERILTVILWPVGILDMPSNEASCMVLGNLGAATLLTVIVTEAMVERLPTLSLDWAVRVWLALVRVVVSKVLLMLDDVEVPKTAPSTYKVIKFKPEVTCPETTGSAAVAEKLILPLTVPVEGEVMETVGLVVSGKVRDWVVKLFSVDTPVLPAASVDLTL